MKAVSKVALTLLLGLSGTSPALAAEGEFTIGDIRVEGLQRIALGTVYNYLPLQKGERLDAQNTSAAIRALFQTGFFEDVVIEREDDVLVVFVKERPAIASIEFAGNTDIPTEQLEENLKLIGLSEGKVFNRSMLDKVKTELQRQYLSLGKYNAQVRTEVMPRERNRVALRIEVAEGEVAAIHHLNIVGNHAFDEDELRDNFELDSDAGWFSSADQYSRQKLSADLETLRSHYMDNGYINFAITSTQVTISPDRQHVYITINVDEGKQYRVSEVTVSGETIVPQEELLELIQLKAGDIYSRKALTESSTRISDRLGDNGYAFANINPIPKLDEETQQLSLTYYVDPGKRVYVRRVNISGNAQTRDAVLRRELRQMEGGWVSTSKIERTRARLNRLGFFDEVKVNTPAVAGSPNEVDLNVEVVERATYGSFNFGLGYGDTQGLQLTASVDWDNFLGTGQQLAVNFSNSEVNRVYSIDFTDPYYTVDGVSRSLSAFLKTTDAGAANTSDYTKDSFGGGIGFGVPVSEVDRVSYRFDYEHSKLNTSATTSQKILDFCADVSEPLACEFDTFKLSSGWMRDTRNRAIFPTEGGTLGVNGSVAIGAEENPQFYKLSLSKRHFLPLADWLTLGVKGEASYAEVYGESTILPPYERYYAGGIRSVRGFQTNRLHSTSGTLDNYGLPNGGNARLLGNVELILPPPFDPDSKSMRFQAFLDFGNVYDTDEGIDTGQLRASYGISMNWLTPVGPLLFSYAIPFRYEDGDDVERFQFSLGMM